MPEYRHKKQYSGIKKPRNTNVPRYWQIISTCQVTVVFALQISTLKTWQNDVTRFARNNDSSNPYLLLSKKKQTPVRMSVFSWQRYKDSNLKWRSQSLAIFFQNRLFKPFFRLSVSQKSLRISFLLNTTNSYEKLRTLHWGVERNSKSALSFTAGYYKINK